MQCIALPTSHMKVNQQFTRFESGYPNGNVNTAWRQSGKRKSSYNIELVFPQDQSLVLLCSANILRTRVPPRAITRACAPAGRHSVIALGGTLVLRIFAVGTRALVIDLGGTLVLCSKRIFFSPPASMRHYHNTD